MERLTIYTLGADYWMVGEKRCVDLNILKNYRGSKRVACSDWEILH